MRLGYNTNGLSAHRWEDAIELIAEAGYQSVALTVDHYCLDPFGKTLARQTDQLQRLLERHKLSCVIETGARFLLDPRHKHEPTLVSATQAERDRRIDFLKRCVNLAQELRADAVSFWAGILRQPWSRDEAFRVLAEGIGEVIAHAKSYDVRLAFEPEPGMLVETMEDYRRLLSLVDDPLLGLTIDVGHLQCVEEPPLDRYLVEWKDRLFNIHIEDMKRGVHDHLRFGEGEIDFPPLFAALRQIDYRGGLHVELSRHSHMGPEVLRESYEFLKRALEHDQS